MCLDFSGQQTARRGGEGWGGERLSAVGLSAFTGGWAGRLAYAHVWHYNLFVYLLIYWRGDMWGGAEGERESQADWPVSAEPEAGLDLTTSGS